MHVVPLDDDPGYPDNLDAVSAPLSCVRALPVEGGTTLLWNANLLHWGGACSLRAAGPRISCSFSLGRQDAREVHGLAPLGEMSTLGLDARFELIARQIVTYGEGQPDIPNDLLSWARATTAMRAARE